MKTLSHFRDLGDPIALIDGSRTPRDGTPATVRAAETESDSFVECRGVLHLWSEED